MKIMVSACLAGVNCKYNGGNNEDARIRALSREHEVICICPEVMGGLPTPRISAEIVDGTVMTRDGRSVDQEYRLGAQKALEIAMRERPDLIILQSRSPSCGVRKRYDGSFTGTLIDGAGVTAQLLIEHGFPVIDIEDLERFQIRRNDTMFTADMIAPCGLDCSICSQALKEKDPCPGCNGPDENKPDFCAHRCGIILCRKRKENGYTYCDECPDYPCEDVMEKENRYTSQYPLKESPLENLRLIRELGMEAFLQQERQRWTCENCGSPIIVHTGICSGCGKKQA